MINPNLYSWNLLTADSGFALDGVMGAYFEGKGNRVWGGWAVSTTYNTQYTSPTGAVWTIATDAPWTGRHTCAYCKVGEVVYMVNGDPYNISNDGVLAKGSYSFDGTTWTTITTDNGLGGYSLGELLELDGDFYFFGGQLTTNPSTIRNEVWKSTDECATFTKIADAPFGGNMGGQFFKLNGKMWNIGGGHYADSIVNRTFPRAIRSSSDGITWTVEGYMPYAMRGRMYSQIVNFAGGAWMIGGFQYRSNPNMNEVWVTSDGVTWIQQTTTFTTGRHAPTAWEVPDGIILGWGSSGLSSETLQADVWKMTLS